MTLTQIKPAGLSKPVDFADNEKIRLGTGNDLEIYHSGNESVIKDNGTGDLFIDSNSSHQIRATSNISLKVANQGELAIQCNADGAVELYYNASKKFETRAYGAQFTDNVKFDNPDTAGRDLTWEADNDSLHWEDNTKATFGAGNDLEIYHDGSNSYLKENGTGGLYQQTNGNGIFLQKTDGENMANFVSDGAVELYHNNVKKFETTSNGVKVTGIIDVQEDIYVRDNKKIYVGDNNDLQIYHNGSVNFIDSPSHELRLRGTYVALQPNGGGEQMAIGTANGSFAIFYDGSEKLATVSNGVSITGNALLSDSTGANSGKLQLGSSQDLAIYHDGTHSYIDSSTGHLYLRSHFTNSNNIYATVKESGEVGAFKFGTSEWLFRGTAGGSFEAHHDGSKKFETTSTGAKLSGHLGVNRDPAGSHPLWVQGSNQYVIGVTNTSAHATHFPWLLHKSINSTQAFGLHFNGLSGDPFHVDQNGGMFLGGETATANRLDDYEIGEYEPTLRGGSSTGTAYSLHGGANTLSYVKVGELVTLFGRLLITAHNNASGTPYLSLPFNSFGGTEQSGLGQFGIYWHGWDVPNDGVGTASLEFAGNNNYAVMIYQRDNASWAGLNDLRTNMGSLYVAIQGSYRCNT